MDKVSIQAKKCLGIFGVPFPCNVGGGVQEPRRIRVKDEWEVGVI